MAGRPMPPPGVGDPRQMRRLRRYFPDFTRYRLLARTEKSLLLAGTYRDQPAVLKMLTSHEPAWRERFAHEATAYQRFAATPPPLTTPALLAPPAPGMLLLRQLPGQPLAATRHPAAHLSGTDLAAILDAADTLAHWTAPHGFPTASDYPDRIIRYGPTGHRLLGSREAETLLALHRSVAPAGTWPFTHGDLLATNILRTDTGQLALLDWEHAAHRLPGHDHALLWVLLADDPAGQDRIVEHIDSHRAARGAFWLNAALLLAREIRIHHDASRTHPALAARIRTLTPLTSQVRAHTELLL